MHYIEESSRLDYFLYFSTEFGIAQRNAETAQADWEELQYELIIAQNRSEVAQTEYEESFDELQNVTVYFNAKLAEVKAKEDIIAGLQENDPTLGTHLKDLDKLNEELLSLNESFIQLEMEVFDRLGRRNETQELLEATIEAEAEKKDEYERLLEVLEDKNATVIVALELFTEASDRYNEAMKISHERAVPTYVECSADGSWFVPGNPYCLGKSVHPVY